MFDDHNSSSGVGADYIALRQKQDWSQQPSVSHAASFDLSRLIAKRAEQKLPGDSIPLSSKKKVKKTSKKYFYACFCGKPAHHQKM